MSGKPTAWRRRFLEIYYSSAARPTKFRSGKYRIAAKGHHEQRKEFLAIADQLPPCQIVGGGVGFVGSSPPEGRKWLSVV